MKESAKKLGELMSKLDDVVFNISDMKVHETSLTSDNEKTYTYKITLKWTT